MFEGQARMQLPQRRQRPAKRFSGTAPGGRKRVSLRRDAPLFLAHKPAATPAAVKRKILLRWRVRPSGRRPDGEGCIQIFASPGFIDASNS
jgi:hypothetical protein